MSPQHLPINNLQAPWTQLWPNWTHPPFPGTHFSCPSPVKLSVHVLVSGCSSIRQSRSSAQLFQDFLINFNDVEITSVFDRQIFLLGEWLLHGRIEPLTTCWVCLFYFHPCFSLLLFTKRILSVHNGLPWGTLPLCLNVKPKCLCLRHWTPDPVHLWIAPRKK